MTAARCAGAPQLDENVVAGRIAVGYALGSPDVLAG